MQPQSTESDLIVRAQRGDEQAVTNLYEMHVDAIFEYISYRVGSRSAAEDLTSDVFVRMVRGLAQYKDRGLPFRAWLFRIAGNLIIDHYRAHKKGPDAPLLDNQPTADTDPLDRVAKHEDQLRMRLAVKALPEEYQNLLTLRFVENLPYVEIAQIMNKTEEALRSMQYRALKALAAQFEHFNQSRGSGLGDRS
jgi:RNA polymerase sigma-70 factor (ECF subfamily)